MRPPEAAPATRLGVMGWPVAHSLSPRMQNAALAAAGLPAWRYQLLPVPPELFAEVVAGLAAAGFRGVNVTIPHKSAALAAAGAPTARASGIGAANTLLFEPEGEVRADNTDAPALIAALPRSVAGATALVLGAGGSARAAVWALLDAGAASVAVHNRTPERARELCDTLGATPVTSAGGADLLVNCTAVGLDGADSLAGLPVAPGDLARFGCVVDFVYTSRGTALIRAARAQGLPTVDGLDLLVRQGALSFELFTGRPAPLVAMHEALAGAAAPDGGGEPLRSSADE